MPSVFAAALRSVATVAATASLGAYAKHRGVLTRSGLKTAERLVAEIATPSLILLKLVAGSGITPDRLAGVAPMALMCLAMVSYGFVAGWCLTRVLRRRHPEAMRRLSGLVCVSIAFPNSFSVPYTLFLALADHPALQPQGAPPAAAVAPSDHHQPQHVDDGHVGRHGPQLSPADQAAELFLLSYVVWVAARWSIGYPALTGACASRRQWLGKMVNPPTVTVAIAVPVGLLAASLQPSAAVRSCCPALVLLILPPDTHTPTHT